MATLALELPRASSPPSRRLVLRIYLFLALFSVALPAMLVRIPPLLDYPNHYVRMWLISGGVKLAPLSQMYMTNWSMARTNIGLDLATRLIGPFVPVEILAPLFLIAALVLPPLGVMLLHRRLFGERSWWTVGAVLVAWSTTLLAGFVNYHIGLGLALVAASLDPMLRGRLTPLQLFAVRAAFSVLLLVVHIFALGFYGVMLAGMAVGPKLVDLLDPKRLRQAIFAAIAAAAGVMIPLFVFAATAPRLPGNGAWAPIWGPTTLDYKLQVLASSFGTYDLFIDCLFMMGPLALVVIGMATRRIRVHQGLLLAALAVMVMALVAPTWAAETGFIDTRLPLMGMLILLAALNPLPSEAGQPAWVERVGALGGTLLLALVLGRSAWIGDIWLQREADIRSIEAAMKQVPAGASVLPVEHKPSLRGLKEAPAGRYFNFGASYLHLYTLSVMERRAWSPLVFAQPGKQPIQVLKPWTDISAPNGGRAPSFTVLQNMPPKWVEYAPYIRDWRNRFDYALMLNADVRPNVKVEPELPGVTLVADKGFARLYKIDRAVATAPVAVKAPPAS